jgi:putative transposase
VVAVGSPHHLTQRGNNRQRVFFQDADYRYYLRLDAEYTKRFDVRVLAYCLMPNHVHWVVVPGHPQSLALAFGRLHSEYACMLHHGRLTSGHVWRNRFYSCVMDEAHCWRAMAYVERNPVRAELAGDAELWNWSSAAAHVGLAQPEVPLDIEEWQARFGFARWSEILRTSFYEESIQTRLRDATRTGRPLAEDPFILRLESALERRLRPAKPGPKRAAASVRPPPSSVVA